MATSRPAEDIPAEAVARKAELTEMLPFAPIVSLAGDTPPSDLSDFSS